MSLNTQNHSNSKMEDTEWPDFMRFEREKTNLTVMEMYERQRDKMPFVIVVTIGNYADIDLETFGADQMFWIAKVSKQKRVIARDIKGRYLTIPVNIPVKFRKVKGYKNVGPIQTLDDILANNELPVSVQFSTSPDAKFKVGSSDSQLYQFGNILLTEVYEEKYFLANSVNNASLYPHAVVIPLYLKEIMIAKVTGIVGSKTRDWERLFLQFTNAAKKVTYDLGMGNKDIALLPEDCALVTSDNIYDYIDPNSFVNVKRRKHSSAVEVSEGGKKKTDDSPPILPTRDTSKTKHFTATDNELKPRKSNTRDSDIDEAFCSGGSVFRNKSDGESFASGGSIDSQTSIDETSISGGSTTSKTAKSGDFVMEYCIDDICENLVKLRLDKYIEPLREAQMDGAFLLSMDEEDLKEDFGMKKYEAVKLMLFARTGHVPR